VLLDHVARPQSKRDLEIYKIAVKKKNRGINLRYYELPAGLKTHKNETAFLDRFKVVDASGRASHTVIAHIAKDGHYYIHPDIRQNRALTVREAARLQTFPDNFVFEGTRTSQFRQIGNAVPPMLSRIIADELLRRLS
jgi:DNA (cytosine-5)-methyltransferase 1